MHARKQVCGDEFAPDLPPRFAMTEQSRKSTKKFYSVATNLQKQTDCSKKTFETLDIIIYT